MTWVREYQTGFEMGRLSETTFTNSVIPPTQFSTSSPITGNLSFLQQGSGGVGYRLPVDRQVVRTNFLFNTVGGLEDIPLVVIYFREPGGIGYLQWAWRTSDWYSDILYSDQNGAIVDRDSVDLTTIRNLFYGSVNASIGIVAFADSGGYASVWINGERVLHFDSTLSGMAQSTEIFAIKIGETNPGLTGIYATRFDDWYVDHDDLDGQQTDTAPPSHRFGIVRPDGAGSATNWNPTSGSNYQNVDEQIGDDDDYNYSSTPNDDDRFTMSSFSLPSDSTISSVIPIARARAGTPDPQLSMRLIAFDGLVSAYGAERELRLGYKYYWDRMTTDPAGGAWSQADVNSLQVGYELRS